MTKILCAFIAIGIFCVDSIAQNNSTNVSPTTKDSAPVGDYVIGASDVLWIDVWHQEEFEIKTITVRPDGKISVRLLQDVQAAGLTPPVLSQRIQEGLKAYVTLPQVTVTVLEFHSQWVTILGNGVAKPGRYPLSGPLNVAELLGISGGWSNFAKKKDVKILRAGFPPFSFNFETFAQGKVDQNIALRSGDIVVVP